ncbi:hypothetical protein V1389_12555 [Flavobacterium rakeshii]|uniref:DUF3885 domain-containing protein n=1 Tax=Flavobacterium rakeshii TaxID=1038845 RepID=UPI002E7C1EA8|nr:hypothetical protein [Flavobacterium rakeshii]MEE1899176.1 hypothetical protein [Flavobacterium rakeshii]
MDKPEYFINNYKKFFSGDNTYKIVFKLNDYLEDNTENFLHVVNKFKEISEYVLANKEVYLLLMKWDKTQTSQDIKSSGFNEDEADSKFKLEDYKEMINPFLEEEDELICLNYNNYDFSAIKKLAEGIAGFELGIESGLNISIYFISFDDYPVLLNMYDDRGMEVLLEDEKAYNEIKLKFSKYLL